MDTTTDSTGYQGYGMPRVLAVGDVLKSLVDEAKYEIESRNAQISAVWSSFHWASHHITTEFKTADGLSIIKHLKQSAEQDVDAIVRTRDDYQAMLDAAIHVRALWLAISPGLDDDVARERTATVVESSIQSYAILSTPAVRAWVDRLVAVLRTNDLESLI